MDPSTVNLLIYLGVSLLSLIISECMALYPSLKANGILHYVALCLDIYKESKTATGPLTNDEAEELLRRRATISRAQVTGGVVVNHSQTQDESHVLG